jgi:hypothetical protein
MEIIRQANRDPEETSEFNSFLQGAASLALQLFMFF